MAELIAAVLGWVVLLAAIGAVSLFVVRLAKAHGILAPLLVGLLLRLVVMLIAHAGSLSLGDHGIFFLDDRTYYRGGSVMADFWRAGHTPDPSRYGILGTYQFGYQFFLGVLFTLGTTSILLGKLVNVLIGGVSVLLIGLLGGRLLGPQARVRAAWIAALAPSLIWWSAPLLKEALATMLVVLGVLAVTALPRRRALIALVGVLAFLMIVRGPAAFALVAGAAVGVAVAGRLAERKWFSRPLVVYVGGLFAGFLVVAAVVSKGNLVGLYNQYDFVVHRMISSYQGGNPARIPYDMIKSIMTPLPWVTDANTRNWDRGLFPGVFVLYAALPLAVVGAWRLRRRPEAWVLLVTAGTAVLINAFTSGFVFRQRSMIEPLILLLALAGATSWRMAARGAAATLAVVAVAAAVQSRSPLVALAIAAGAALVFVISRRVPSEPFGPIPESPMVAAFRRSFEARPAGGLVAPLGRAVTSGWAARARLARLAPQLNPPPLQSPARGAHDGGGRLASRLGSHPDKPAKLSAVGSAHSTLVRLAPQVETPRAREADG